jgi:predicted pyridoxine 5'-phosphate oxidase superfamily flavin-nucleotide-binding protein
LFRENITPDYQAFIERMDMFFLATADRDGRPNCSYKGGDPGFVRVIDSNNAAGSSSGSNEHLGFRYPAAESPG